MSYRTRTRDQHLANDGTPKRILASTAADCAAS